MKRTSILHNQNLIDVAIQKQGDVRSVFEIALANDISITDTLFAGLKIDVFETEFFNLAISDYYRKRDQQIATDNLNSIDLYIFSQTLPFIL